MVDEEEKKSESVVLDEKRHSSVEDINEVKGNLMSKFIDENYFDKQFASHRSLSHVALVEEDKNDQSTDS